VSEVGDNQADEGGTDGELVPGEQVVEARLLPVAADARSATGLVTRKVSLPATAAAAGGGFMLGVTAFMLLRVLRRPTAARSASRSFLVDVHLLKR
jgi:hypothetical protein